MSFGFVGRLVEKPRQLFPVALASRYRAHWPDKHIGLSPGFVTCLPRGSFSSLDFRSILQPYRQCCYPPLVGCCYRGDKGTDRLLGSSTK